MRYNRYIFHQNTMYVTKTVTVSEFVRNLHIVHSNIFNLHTHCSMRISWSHVKRVPHRYQPHNMHSDMCTYWYTTFSLFIQLKAYLTTMIFWNFEEELLQKNLCLMHIPLGFHRIILDFFVATIRCLNFERGQVCSHRWNVYIERPIIIIYILYFDRCYISNFEYKNNYK